jgi:hypothetical protein
MKQRPFAVGKTKKPFFIFFKPQFWRSIKEKKRAAQTKGRFCKLAFTILG